ncbi:MAG TPA: peroxiredoxin family protein [Dongiaceae bacterium]|nr:peroxiredoxin family protein [Dongiaceae bacterium]
MRSLVWGLLIACLTSTALAQTEPKSSPPAQPSPSRSTTTPAPSLTLSGHVTAGDNAPSFELASSSGQQRSLRSLKGDWVVLLFMPSKSDFIRFRESSADFARLPATLVGITVDNPQTLRNLANKEKLPFELLGDVTAEVSATYGMWDAAASATHPGMVVVDRRGIIKLVVSGQVLPPDQVLSLTSLTIQGS